MDPARPLSPVDLLAELLQGYRHPAAATDERGVVVYMNPAAVNGDQASVMASADAKDWPSLAGLRTPDGQTFMLRRPAWVVDAYRRLPPCRHGWRRSLPW